MAEFDLFTKAENYMEISWINCFFCGRELLQLIILFSFYLLAIISNIFIIIFLYRSNCVFLNMSNTICKEIETEAQVVNYIHRQTNNTTIGGSVNTFRVHICTCIVYNTHAVGILFIFAVDKT